MADDTQVQADVAETTSGNDTAVAPAVAENTEQPADHMIPKSRFDEVNNKLKELTAAQEKAAKEREQAERTRLEQQNEFKSLYEQAQKRIQELEPVQEKYQGFLDQTKERNEARVNALPKEMRTLVPEYDDPIRLGQWLDANESVLTKKPTAPSLDANVGKNSQNGSSLSLAEVKEQAARLNVDWRHLASQYGVQITN